MTAWRISVFIAICITAFTGIHFHGVSSEQFVVNFKVIHEAIVDCPDKGSDEIQLRIQLLKLNRTTQVMNGNISFARDFDDEMFIHVKLWTWQNGGWKAGTGLDFTKSQGCTSLIAVLGPVWKEVSKKANMAPKCPYKKGTSYKVRDFDTRVWDKLPLPGAPVNKYKFELKFETAEKQVKGCYSSIFRVAKKHN